MSGSKYLPRTNRNKMNHIHLALEEYLGDSVYAGIDGEYLVLCTKNDDECGNIIFLEPQVVEALLRYLARISKATE